LVVADYGDLLDETVSRGQLYTSAWIVGGYDGIALSSTGRAEISKTGTTKFGIRSSRDIYAYAPSGNEHVTFSSYEGGHAAKLEVTYSVPVPPTVTTNAASNVASTSATLNGYLNSDGGEACWYRFQYGTTTSYGTDTAWTGSITSGQSFSQSISGLSPGTTYHFRAQCKNSSVTPGSGGDLSFTTLLPVDDDGVLEVGADWIGHYDERPWIPTWVPTWAFMDKMESEGWQRGFLWEDNTAYELDFKRDDSGGWDDIYADAVDIAWFAGHGDGGELYFNYGETEEDLVLKSGNAEAVPPEHPQASEDEARWGDQDLEWVFLFSCNTLERWDGTKGGSDFGWALNGAHLICGFVDEVWIEHDDGWHVAKFLVDDHYTVKDSWFYGCNVHQAAGITLRVIGEDGTCGGDHIWGEGWLSTDPPVNSAISRWDFETFD
jgi:hypothetical protein